MHALKHGYKPPNICKRLPKLAKPVRNMHFHLISKHFTLQRLFVRLNSAEQGVQFPLMLKLDASLCVEGLPMHRVPSGMICCIFFAISSSGCHGADRCGLTCTTALTKHTQAHSSRGLSPAGGGSPAKAAGWLTAFIFITHTLIGTDRARVRTHTRTHTRSWEKYLLLSKINISRANLLS